MRRIYAAPETAIGRTPVFHGDQPTSFNSYEPSSQMKYSDKILVAEKLQHILRDQQQLQQQQQQPQQQPYQQQPVRYAHTEVGLPSIISYDLSNIFPS